MNCEGGYRKFFELFSPVLGLHVLCSTGLGTRKLHYRRMTPTVPGTQGCRIQYGLDVRTGRADVKVDSDRVSI